MIAHNKKTLLKPIRRETKTETGDVILEEDTYMLSGITITDYYIRQAKT